MNAQCHELSPSNISHNVMFGGKNLCNPIDRVETEKNLNIVYGAGLFTTNILWAWGNILQTGFCYRMIRKKRKKMEMMILKPALMLLTHYMVL